MTVQDKIFFIPQIHITIPQPLLSGLGVEVRLKPRKRSNPRPLMPGMTALFYSLLDPMQALAVQAHGGTAEGLVVHQLGHVLFVGGLLFLLNRLRRLKTSDYGGFEFKLFLWLIILWNALAFHEHWYQETINPDKFIRTAGKISGFIISTPLDALYYFSRMDHLLLLPAFLFLMAALNKWRKQG